LLFKLVGIELTDMENKTPSPKPWYKRKRYIVTLVAVGVLMVSGLTSSDQAASTSLEITSPPALSQPAIKQVIPVQVNTAQKQDLPSPATNSGLSNNNYYTNTYGNEVHSPAYSETVPQGASAKCGDGTYSFSQSRRGTCSHHGGVVKWL
jgi:hypothetical protein